MRWTVALGAGLALSVALLVAAIATTPAYGEGPSVQLPFYLLWAAMVMVCISFALAWLLVIRESQPSTRHSVRGVVLVAVAIALLPLGEAAIYVAKHPTSRLCFRTGETLSCTQPNTAQAESRAGDLFLAGTGALAALTAATFAATRRRPKGA